jgi:hypothetical protein
VSKSSEAGGNLTVKHLSVFLHDLVLKSSGWRRFYLKIIKKQIKIADIIQFPLD